MDNLAEAFAAAQVTFQPNSTAAEHPHFALYKAKSTLSSQESRRKKFLEAQKVKRFNYSSHARGLATNEWSDDEAKNEIDDESESMDYAAVKPPPRTHKDQLMLSEWLVEVPSDLESEWLLKLCPVGKRCLVIASRGLTKIYAKSGYQLNSFKSKLPGGSRESRGYTILDCIFNELAKTYYVLDVMCWKQNPCFDTETTFRFYWLKSKFEEHPVILNDSPFKFVPLPFFDCSSKAIKEALWQDLPFEPQLDGLLFYHKKTYYTSGSTPLVGWLKGYMMPEMLNIDVPESLMKEKPVSYTTMKEHCPEAFIKNEERKKENEKIMEHDD